MQLHELLFDAVRSPNTAAVVIDANLRPVGGEGSIVMPPTFGVDRTASDEDKANPYLYEQLFIDGTETKAVVLDQWSSQANRCEEALLGARDCGRLELPLLELCVETSRGPVRITSLDAPHRYADAYWRDSLVDGVRFDKSPVGVALRSVSVDDVRPLYEREPISLLLGAWDSHRKGRWPRFARAYHSRVVGLDPVLGGRRGSRIDPVNLTGGVSDVAAAEADWEFVADGEKRKGTKLSEIGHGNIPPSTAHGGVSVRSVHRRASVSLALLRRLRFGDAPADAADTARSALLALALAADRLAFGGASIWLRSGCDLLVLDEAISLEQRGGVLEPLDIDVDEMISAFHHLRDQAADHGVGMATDVVSLDPIPALRDAIEFATASATTEDD